MKTQLRAMRRAKGLFLAGIVASLAFSGRADAASARTITIWLMPSEEAEARATANVLDVAAEIRDFNQWLQRAGGRVRVLNTVPPRDAQLIVFNSAFAVPNWARVKNQRETIAAIQRFARDKDVRVDILFETWDSAFAGLSLLRGRGALAPPDVAQIGSTWAAHFASRRLIVPRAKYDERRGAWQDVNGVPACVLPYINDVRLLFSWSRLPTQDRADPPVILNPSDWVALLDSLRRAGLEDRIAFAGGLTLNLIMDYAMLVWAGGGEPIVSSWWGPHAELASKRVLQFRSCLPAPRPVTGAGGC